MEEYEQRDSQRRVSFQSPIKNDENGAASDLSSKLSPKRKGVHPRRRTESPSRISTESPEDQEVAVVNHSAGVADELNVIIETLMKSEDLQNKIAEKINSVATSSATASDGTPNQTANTQTAVDNSGRDLQCINADNLNIDEIVSLTVNDPSFESLFAMVDEIEKMTLPESRPPPTVNPKRPPSSDDSVLNFPSLSSHYSRPYEENSGTSPPEAIETAEVYSEHGTDGVTRTVFKHPKKKEQVHHQQGKGGVVHYGEEQYQQKCGMTCQESASKTSTHKAISKLHSKSKTTRVRTESGHKLNTHSSFVQINSKAAGNISVRNHASSPRSPSLFRSPIHSPKEAFPSLGNPREIQSFNLASPTGKSIGWGSFVIGNGESLVNQTNLTVNTSHKNFPVRKFIGNPVNVRTLNFAANATAKFSESLSKDRNAKPVENRKEKDCATCRRQGVNFHGSKHVSEMTLKQTLDSSGGSEKSLDSNPKVDTGQNSSNASQSTSLDSITQFDSTASAISPIQSAVSINPCKENEIHDLQSMQPENEDMFQTLNSASQTSDISSSGESENSFASNTSTKRRESKQADEVTSSTPVVSKESRQNRSLELKEASSNGKVNRSKHRRKPKLNVTQSVEEHNRTKQVDPHSCMGQLLTSPIKPDSRQECHETDKQIDNRTAVKGSNTEKNDLSRCEEGSSAASSEVTGDCKDPTLSLHKDNHATEGTVATEMKEAFKCKDRTSSYEQTGECAYHKSSEQTVDKPKETTYASAGSDKKIVQNFKRKQKKRSSSRQSTAVSNEQSVFENSDKRDESNTSSTICRSTLKELDLSRINIFDQLHDHNKSEQVDRKQYSRTCKVTKNNKTTPNKQKKLKYSSRSARSESGSIVLHSVRILDDSSVVKTAGRNVLRDSTATPDKTQSTYHNSSQHGTSFNSPISICSASSSSPANESCTERLTPPSKDSSLNESLSENNKTNNSVCDTQKVENSSDVLASSGDHESEAGPRNVRDHNESAHGRSQSRKKKRELNDADEQSETTTSKKTKLGEKSNSDEESKVVPHDLDVDRFLSKLDYAE